MRERERERVCGCVLRREKNMAKNTRGGGERKGGMIDRRGHERHILVLMAGI